VNYGRSCFHPHVEEITEALVQHFGRPTLGNKKNPFNELLYIILSSRTPPDVYQETYRLLRRGFKTANSIAEARTEYVAATIEQGGYTTKKHALSQRSPRSSKRRTDESPWRPSKRWGRRRQRSF
jgi:endonuclease III